MVHADQPADECFCARSLASTLIGALTMFIFFMTQMWGFKATHIFRRGFSVLQIEKFKACKFILENTELFKLLEGVALLIMTMCQPLFVLHAHVKMALEAWEMGLRLKKVPEIRSGRGKHSTKWTDSNKYWESSSLRSLFAATVWIKLPPEQQIATSTPPEQIPLQPEPPEQQIATSTQPEEASAVEKSDPLEIFPEMMLNQSLLHEAGRSAAVNSSVRDQYVLLSTNMKQALLELGLVPSHKQLQYVKSKSRLEIAIVAMQAAGYLLGILERMAADQRISPIEALATFLGILMILHALLDWFASSFYKRALLFHLSPPQSTAWKNRLEIIRGRQSSRSDAAKLRPILIFLTTLLPLVPAIYFAIDFLVPHHRCLICFVPALFFSLNLILLISSYFIAMTSTKLYQTAEYIVLSVLALLFVSSIVIGVIATILEWDHKFNEPTKSWYRWIIPHIGS